MTERAPNSAIPLNIALLTHSVNPRGGVVHTLELADALHERGHRVTVFAPALAGQSMFRATRCALELVPLASTGPSTGPSNGSSTAPSKAVGAASSPAERVVEQVATRRQAFVDHFKRALAARRFDVLHAQDAIGANALADLEAGGVIAGFIRTVHHLDYFDDARLMSWQQRAFVQASQVLCVSRTWCEQLQAEHGVAAALVHNGVNLARYTRMRDATDARVALRYGLRPGAPLLLAVGGVEERKNSLRMLEAFVEFRASRPRAQLVIAGGASLLDHDDYARRFQATLAASGLRGGIGGDVVITGPVPDDDMPALLRAADALAMASLREGFGLVVLEALACGTPAVVSRIAPFTEYLAADERIDHACWADPDSATSIAHAFERACDSEHKASLASGTSAVCARFSWQASAAAHEAIYRAHRARQVDGADLAVAHAA